MSVQSSPLPLMRQQPLRWIDTHVHWDAKEFAGTALASREKSAIEGVAFCVIPAVERANFDAVRVLAHQMADGYALGIHPMYTPQADAADLQVLDEALSAHRDDPRLLAVGEVGLDFFVPELAAGAGRDKQTHFFHEQLRLARKHGLPVILHVRRAVDAVIHGLRRFAPDPQQRGGWRGIAHAYNGSAAQAEALVRMGLKLGFGGGMTHERATHVRHLAATLPLSSLVLETDAPDIPPQWLYRTAQQRARGQVTVPNSPAELPRIARVLADLRQTPLDDIAHAVWANSLAALPKLQQLLPRPHNAT